MNKSDGGLWPEERSYHGACCLNYGQQFPQLLVTGGLDRQGNPLADAWILDIHRGKWRKVKLKPTKIIFVIHLLTPWEILLRILTGDFISFSWKLGAVIYCYNEKH